MLVKDIISSGKKTFSLEVFPPKGTLSQRDVNHVVCATEALSPSWVSVTCSAGGIGAKDNVKTADFILRCGLTPVAHLTCVGETEKSVDAKVFDLLNAGVSNIMVLRGDLKEPPKEDTRFTYASDLVKYIKSKWSSVCVGVAAYPETHTESKTFTQDIEVLKIKQDCGADYAVTQLFFYNDTYYRLRDVANRSGVKIPIIPGVMPIISYKTIKRICSISNITIDPSLFSVLTMYGESPESIQCAGLAYTTKQIVDLLASGVSNIHFYTMNKPELAKKVYSNIEPLIRN